MNSRIIWHMMPAGSEKHIRKSAEIGVDAIIPCLEDGVLYNPEDKQAARELVVRMSREIDWRALGILVYPRINRTNTDYWRDDVRTLLDGSIDGIYIAKEESPDRVRDVDALLAEEEEKRDLPVGGIGIVVMIETAAGIRNCYELATACARVEGVMVGREDLSADLGVLRRHGDLISGRNEELMHARSKVVLDTRAAGKEAYDGASLTFSDEEYMLEDCSLTARMGFTGKLSAHPRHAETIRRSFAPEPEDVEIAAEMVARAEGLMADGVAPITGVAGMEVTPPVVAQARLVLERAKWAGIEVGEGVR